MACNFRSMRNLALLALLAATIPTVLAQNNLPELSTATQATALSSSKTDATTGKTTGTTDQSTTGQSTTGQTSSATSNTAQTTSTGQTTSATTGTSTTGTSSGSITATFTGLTGLPSIAGAGIPDMVIPYTANAPFMQKSTLPEGTVFIAVGAVLAFLGACVLLWRGLVAWSINRSVKRSAHAAMRGSEKTSTTWGGSNNGGGGGKGGAYFSQHETGSNMSLDALTSAGKPVHRSSHVPDEHRKSSAPHADLFFSPTAQAASNRVSSALGNHGDRNSTYLPSGYYASPSAEHAGANPRTSTTNIGSSLAPYARYSSVNPSPPGSPGLPNSRGTSNYYGGTRGGDTSRDGLRANDGLLSSSRDGYGSQRNSFMYAHPSTSSLQVGTGVGRARSEYDSSNEHLGGQRAPSAVLDELFENHGHGPRERF